MFYRKISVCVLLLTTCALAVVGIVAAITVECVVVAMNSAVSEVENLLGVNCNTHETSLEVEVWASAASGVTAKCDRGAGFHILVLLNKELREVTINGLKSVVVAQYHIESVAVTLKLGDANLASKCCINSVAYIGF